MINGEKAQFCAGRCPNVPEDLVVEVDAVRQPEFGEDYDSANVCRVICAVAASSDPATPVGAVETFTVAAEGRTPEQVEEAIYHCTDPKVGWLAKALGSRGTCQAVEIVN